MLDTLTIRADCSQAIGTGHVMRMIALGQAWSECGGNVHFIGKISILKDRLHAEGFKTTEINNIHPDPNDAQALLDATSPNDWVAIDGYHFDTSYQQTLRRAGRKTIVVDDLFDRDNYDATILLNQNPNASEYPYKLDRESVLLLGTRYTLLRKEFRQYTDRVKKHPNLAKKILITLGGADSENITSKVISALKPLEGQGFEIKVIAGAANPNLPQLKAQIEQLDASCELLTHVEDMASIIRWADMALSAAGTTSWELCFFGIPFIAIQIADNQRDVIQELNKYGAALCFENVNRLKDNLPQLKKIIQNKEIRQSMSHAGRKLIDGEGASRVVKTIQSLSYTITTAMAHHCLPVYSIANDPKTRQFFFSTAPISLETHIQWYSQRIANKELPFYVIQNQMNNVVGYVRFELEDKTPYVSIAVQKDVRGQSVGSRLLNAAVEKFFINTQKYNCVKAKIKMDNIASRKAFSKAGFNVDGTLKNDSIITFSRQR